MELKKKEIGEKRKSFRSVLLSDRKKNQLSIS